MAMSNVQFDSKIEQCETDELFSKSVVQYLTLLSHRLILQKHHVTVLCF